MENDIDEPFFFGSHPRLQERIDNFSTLIEQAEPLEGPNRKGTEAYISQMLPVILMNAGLDLDAGRFGSAKRGIQKYQHYQPDDPYSHALLGTVYFEEKKDNFTRKALEQFQRAVALDSECADAYRGIGLIAYKQGNCGDARTAFQRYLSISPDAPDRQYIEYYLTHCQ